MSRYDGKTGAELLREYAKAQPELAAENPDIAISCGQNAAEWDRLADRAGEGWVMSKDESIWPTAKEWRQMMREQASEEGQQAQRDSVRTAEAARAAGRSIAEQRLHESEEGTR